MVNEKASSLWKLARFLVKWSPGYHYIVMFWWWIGYKLINDRNYYRVHEHIYTSLSVTSTGNLRLCMCSFILKTCRNKKHLKLDCTLYTVKTFVQTTLINNKHTDFGSTLQWQITSYPRRSKANLRDLIAATCLINLTQIGLKSSIFQPVWPWNLMDDLEKL